MRRHRIKQLNDTPEIMLSPMIDLIFLLLVFFIISTMHMVDIKTIPMELPKAQFSKAATGSKMLLSIKQDGSLYLGDEPITLSALTSAAQAAYSADANAGVIVRADGSVDYKVVVKVLDTLKGAGIKKISLATESGS